MPRTWTLADFVSTRLCAHSESNLELGEAEPRELPNLPLEDALQLVHLCAERGSPKYEKAAGRRHIEHRFVADRHLLQYADR